MICTMRGEVDDKSSFENLGEEGGKKTPNLNFSDAKSDCMILSALPLGLTELHWQGSK